MSQEQQISKTTILGEAGGAPSLLGGAERRVAALASLVRSVQAIDRMGGGDGRITVPADDTDGGERERLRAELARRLDCAVDGG